MAEDSKIQVIDFLNEVESNRRSLIANAQSKGKVISSGASLTQAVAVNNSISPSASPEKIEVRFFDADGTLLKQEFIDYGGSVTPPPNPNYDPERLTFKRWASAIGERFDNITHDVDYGALYTINNGGFHLFLTIDDNSGYTVTLAPYQNVAHTITIDWGDGTENDTKTNTGTTNISHTYAQAGDYEIVVTRDVDIFEYSSDYWYLSSYVISTSSNSDIFNGFRRAYMICLYGNNFYLSNAINYSVNIDVIITENIFNFMSNCYIYYVKNIILNNSLYHNPLNIYGDISNMFIIDTTFNCDNLITFRFNGNLDKIIFPHFARITSSPYTLRKVIYLDAVVTDKTYTNIYSLESIQILSDSTFQLSELRSASNLKEYIFPNSVKNIKGRLADGSNLNFIVIPDNCIFENDVFDSMYYLRNIVLYKDFDISFTIYSYDFSTESFVDILNKVKDNTGLTARTLTIQQASLQTQMLRIYVVYNNGLWQLATIDTPNAMTLVEAFNSKNWTIS